MPSRADPGDVKKIGTIPDGSRWRYVGRVASAKNRSGTRARAGVSNAYRNPKVRTCFVHTVIGDHTASPTPSATTTRPR